MIFRQGERYIAGVGEISVGDDGDHNEEQRDWRRRGEDRD